jgi:hypothetical protein
MGWIYVVTIPTNITFDNNNDPLERILVRLQSRTMGYTFSWQHEKMSCSFWNMTLQWLKQSSRMIPTFFDNT